MTLADRLRLMVITNDVVAARPGRDLVTICRAAVSGGATMIQVRLKRAAARETVQTTRALVQALSVPVIVNDRLDVALIAGAAGCHLGQDDLPLAAARRIAPPGFIIGASVGSLEEARAAAAVPDYWSIGPCFATGTKPDAGPPLLPDGFARLRRLAPKGMPVIGIGGITAANAGSLRGAGASGMAVVAAVFSAADPAAAASAVRAAFESA
jgi:thiamine-phosphate pyrophosphorylase